MERFLDIIIPEYNSEKNLLIRALNSINTQKNVDFSKIGIIIISDASKTRYKKTWFKQRFPKLSIEYYYKESNDGPGVTRQYGIDKSSAQYITCLDQDDVFYDNYVLTCITDNLSYNSVNVLWTNFSEEIFYNGKILINSYKPSDYPTLHGLFINREFLIQNNIRFSDELKFNEDMYFAEVLMYCFETSYLDVTTYLWKYNDNSAVRKNKKINWNISIIDYYITALKLIYEKLELYNKDIRHKKIIAGMYGAFLILNSSEFNDEEKKNRCIRKLIEIYKDVKAKSFDLYSREEKEEIYKKQFEVTYRTIQSINYNNLFEEWLEQRL